MLKYLHIENIAVIEQSNIDFTKGFNLLTGETGAGKSIVIDAINAVLGERTSKELIRNGCDKATVSAHFGELDSETLALLEQNGLSADEDGELYISRVLSLEGKGSIRINGQAVTATVLREIGKTLINIHGQHDNQNLLNPEKHLMFIDRLAANEELLKIYLDEFNNFKSIRKEMQELESDEEQKERRLDYLKFQIDELEKAQIRCGELSELKEKISIAKRYEKTIESLNKTLCAINGDEESSGAIDKIAVAKKDLLFANLKGYEDDCNALEDIQYRLEEICSHIEEFVNNSEFSPENLNVMSERLDLIKSLMLKYGDSEEKLIISLENAKKEFEKIKFSDERLIQLEEMLSASQDRLIEKAENLSVSRKKTARSFEKSVCDILNFLDMPAVRFVVNFKKGRYTKNGADEVEFYISANAGETVKPLAKIASGGELSRVMLAIQNVLLDKNDVDTLIFDEIDTGISGRAADKVGIVLKKVAKSHQVICVTHLAQIAANADTHFLIEKNVCNDRTFTNLTKLDYEGRIKEIARIMSGTQMTQNLYNSAKELLDRSNQNENL